MRKSKVTEEYIFWSYQFVRENQLSHNNFMQKEQKQQDQLYNALVQLNTRVGRFNQAVSEYIEPLLSNNNEKRDDEFIRSVIPLLCLSAKVSILCQNLMNDFMETQNNQTPDYFTEHLFPKFVQDLKKLNYENKTKYGQYLRVQRQSKPQNFKHWLQTKALWASITTLIKSLQSSGQQKKESQRQKAIYRSEAKGRTYTTIKEDEEEKSLKYLGMSQSKQPFKYQRSNSFSLIKREICTNKDMEEQQFEKKEFDRQQIKESKQKMKLENEKIEFQKEKIKFLRKIQRKNIKLQQQKEELELKKQNMELKLSLYARQKEDAQKENEFLKLKLSRYQPRGSRLNSGKRIGSVRKNIAYE